MERVIVFSLLLDFAHESRIEGREKNLGGGKTFQCVVLFVEGKVLGTESLGVRDGVAEVTLDIVCHLGCIFGIGEVSNGVHPTIGEMVPDSVLEVDEAADLREGGHHAGTTKVVPLL